MIKKGFIYFAFLVVLTVISSCSRIPTDGRPASGNNEANMISSAGTTLGGPNAAEPAITAGTDGKVYVAYVEKNTDGGGDLFVAPFDANAKSVGKAARVNPVDGQVRTWYGDPPTLAIGTGGEVYVSWTAKYPDGGKGTILFLSKSSDGGETFAEPVKINDDTEPASHGMHSISIAPNGSIVAAWLDERYLKKTERAGYSPLGMLAFFHHTPTPKPEAKAETEPDAELYFAVSKDGGRTFSANKRIDEKVCPCCKVSIAIRPDGTMFIGYRKVYEGSFRHITVISSANGEEFSKPVQVSDDKWQIDACPVSGAALRFEGQNLAIAWYSGGKAREEGVYTAVATDASATSFSTPTLVEAFKTGGNPMWAGGKVVWSNDGTLKTQTGPIGEGRNVVAVGSDGRAVVAYTVNSNEKKSVVVKVAE